MTKGRLINAILWVSATLIVARSTSTAFEYSSSTSPRDRRWHRVAFSSAHRRRQEPHTSSATIDAALHNHPEGLLVEQDAVSEDTWKIVEHWLLYEQFPNETTKSPIPWEIGAQNRRVAQFGFRYNYDTSVVEYADDGVPEIPQALRELLLESCQPLLDGKKVDPSAFTQCIINVYQADDIIPWHWDHVDFGPVVVVFVFGEDDRPLNLRRLKDSVRPTAQLPSSQCHYEEGAHAEEDYEYCTVHPRHRSCYVLSGPVRYEWEHSVPPGKGYRVSITFRTHIQDHTR